VINKFPLMSRFLLIVIIPLSILFSVVYIHLKNSLSPSSGQLNLEGLAAPVRITHDAYGTPSIDAQSDRDAYFAIGFKHASDRLWQLELQRRLAQGRLSEVLGEGALREDIWMRTLGLQHAATESIPYLSAEAMAALRAYSDGINAWVKQAASLPIEFQLLGVGFEPWTPYDSLSWQKVFSLTLSGNMYDEMRRNLLQGRLSPAQLKYFYPYDPAPTTVAAAPLKNNIIAQSKALLAFGIGHPFTGSNAWVVAGKYTQSGHPLLANDPHVGLQLPALWYPAALKGDKLKVSGMTLVGLPMVIFGQNSHIAWGGTSLESDQEDLFIETVSPQQPNHYLEAGAWKKFETRREVINIAPAFPAALQDALHPIEIQVRKTLRGPIISDASPGADEVISLRWAALDSEDHTLEAFFKVQYAKNWGDFRQALALLKSPGLSFVYADKENNIGLQVAGMFPLRGEGVGVLPVVASAQANWRGYADFSLLPSLFNPERGYIVSANERIAHSADIVISHEWAPMARHQRISQLLQQSIDAKQLLTAQQMGVIQGDRKDLTALELLPFFIQTQVETPQAQAAIAALSRWDGEFRHDSIGATLFATWSYYLAQDIFGEVLAYSWMRPETGVLLAATLEQMDWSQLAKVMSTSTHGWCHANQARPCALELTRSLNSALKQLEKISQTAEVTQWTWERFSTTEFVHQPFGRMKGVGQLFTRKVKAVASPNSVNASNMLFDGFNGFTQNFGASFRQVFELDEHNSHWYSLSTGVSGNIMSPHFDDMIDVFSANTLIPFMVNSHPEESFMLVPRAVKK
jgi:penicillin G amidase